MSSPSRSPPKSPYPVAKMDDVINLTSLVLTIHDVPGTLADITQVFRDLRVNMQHIESHPSKNQGQYEIRIDLDHRVSKSSIDALTAALIAKGVVVQVVGNQEIAWFPRHPQDLDHYVNRILEGGAELQSDHPGFNDAEYRMRRERIAEIARNYKAGESIPEVEYTPQEVQVWAGIFTRLQDLYQKHACKEFLRVFPMLIEHCGYGVDKLPQLNDINRFLRRCTGFTVRPVAGLLSSRDFLNGLAFRVFHSTQYIRHHSVPLYTPEPDICHELLGHVPLFADPSFAEFSQEIGLASLAATDDDIKKLATLYWFTVEFGMCRQDGQLKAYGAGLLSSFGELEYCMSGKPELRPFDPPATATQDYPITTYQPVYFVAESFDDATNKVRAWAANMKKPFNVYYDPYTQNVEILDSNEKIFSVLSGVTSQLVTLQRALAKKLTPMS